MSDPQAVQVQQASTQGQSPYMAAFGLAGALVLMGLLASGRWSPEPALAPPLVLAGVALAIVGIARRSHKGRSFASVFGKVRLSGNATLVALWVLCFTVLQAAYLLSGGMRTWNQSLNPAPVEAADHAPGASVSITTAYRRHE